MKIFAIVLDVLVLGLLLTGMFLLLGDRFWAGGIVVKLLLLAGVIGVFAILRKIYWALLFPYEKFRDE